MLNGLCGWWFHCLRWALHYLPFILTFRRFSSRSALRISTTLRLISSNALIAFGIFQASLSATCVCPSIARAVSGDAYIQAEYMAAMRARRASGTLVW